MLVIMNIHSRAFQSGVKNSSITIVCHRVVHGGDYAEPVIISSKEYHHIEKLTDLAPL